MIYSIPIAVKKPANMQLIRICALELAYHSVAKNSTALLLNVAIPSMSEPAVRAT